MRIRFFGAALLAGTVLAGCLEDPEDPESCTPTPLFCNHARPAEADLTIRVSTPLPEVVSVYAGTGYESGRLVWSGAPQGLAWSVRLPLGDYSVTASYKRGSKTIIAVDGDDLDYEATETCDGNCYDEVDGAVNLELAD